jgi:hypothetical protein
MALHGRFIVVGGLSLFKANSTLWTLPQARTEPVAIGIADQLSFAVDYLNRPLGTGGHAEPAAIAFVFVNLDDLPETHRVLPQFGVLFVSQSGKS